MQESHTYLDQWIAQMNDSERREFYNKEMHNVVPRGQLNFEENVVPFSSLNEQELSDDKAYLLR